MCQVKLNAMKKNKSGEKDRDGKGAILYMVVVNKNEKMGILEMPNNRGVAK